jgi:hypothetical protein
MKKAMSFIEGWNSDIRIKDRYGATDRCVGVMGMN